MNTLIFRTVAPLITVAMIAFSIFILLRGHNEPGGGFIGGLIGAAAIAIHGIAGGPESARRALRADPLALAGVGILLAGAAGLLSAAWQLPFLTGLWASLSLDGATVELSTPLLFDIGVYCAVFGTVSAIALALEDGGEDA